MNSRISWLAVLLLLVSAVFLPGCDRDTVAPLAPETTLESARPSVVAVDSGSDAIAAETMDFALGLIDDLLSGDPARADQALATLEAIDPGFYQRMIEGLSAAAGGDALVLELEVPEVMGRQGGGTHKIKITIEGQLTVKKDSWFSVAGAKTEFLDDTTVKISETFEFEVDCGEGVEIESRTRTTKTFDDETLPVG